MFCRNCGKEVSENAEICTGCGAKPRSGNSYCQSCGSKTDPIAEICINCGAKLAKAGLSSTNIEPNVAGLLCYLAGWLTGLIFIIIEKQNEFVRFHAVQSIIVFGGFTVIHVTLSVLQFIPYAGILFLIIQSLIGIFTFILWIFLMIKD
jgi:uncharacterized membrane protein